MSRLDSARLVPALLGVLLAGCAAGAAARAPGASAAAPASAERDVGAVLDDWHDAAARADEPRYFGHFAPAGVFLGTDAKERWTVDELRAYAHPHFARGKAWTFHPRRRAIAAAGDVAWFDEDLDTPHLGPARGSGVLVRTGAGWKIAQYNLSVPIPNERFKAVKALVEEPDAR